MHFSNAPHCLRRFRNGLYCFMLIFVFPSFFVLPILFSRSPTFKRQDGTGTAARLVGDIVSSLPVSLLGLSALNMSLTIEASHQLNPAQVGDLDVFDDHNSARSYHLTNSVHRLWCHRNWSRNIRLEHMPSLEGPYSTPDPSITPDVQGTLCTKLPTQSSQRILPALRLASLFLEKSLPWFWNLLYAPSACFGPQR